MTAPRELCRPPLALLLDELKRINDRLATDALAERTPLPQSTAVENGPRTPTVPPAAQTA